jgi:alpha-tubulin suppressor-like RCC1 family protein
MSFPSLVNKSFSSSSSPFAFVLLQDGSLYAIGCNDHGQLGLGDAITRKRPTLLRTIFPSPVVKVATGRFHALALLANGDVYASGSNISGQCGLGANSKARDYVEFTKVDDLRSIVDIACGWEHSLACDQEGRLFTFGHPNFGQLGNRTTGEFIKESQRVNFDFVSSPYMVSKFVSKDRHGSLREEYPASAVHIVQVAAGRNHSVCIEGPAPAEGGGSSGQAGSRVFAWGFGGYGRLGHNSVDSEYVAKLD